ncbi:MULTISPECIES: aconitate hydratase [unclassified Polaromonas]|jgi:aconitate hydratase|uniref:aconitate hydratase n=1 Tax=unclassified Polaromonas TaxID=2638319 RepID=UPI000BDDC241|nr:MULTISPECIES: aconitate hydratase [unclassified Polaromonas]OYY36588.1 MAG: aconitate hydratase [Polaromonas sp. 35-63-35]OYZ22825.1 MAG: aconitate hydratase [Polaromonas sp. 16-63-31]OYZ80963.1 MAG: aconitate hydratase [Polaromonas sp. 24-63-21]OZA52819.1 MAG: aconitate hydratase [Polaromonas sp. 17-63-33]OZA88328.1 MAG: aconitate hydratase [Polaromonas sp. 39-63-25]
MAHEFAKTLKTFTTASGKTGRFYSLPALAKQYPKISRLPVSMRIVLESVLRNCDGEKVSAEHVRQLANWFPNADRTEEIPFVVSRVVLQDFTGVPLLADLAAMRSVAIKLGKNPKAIEPLVPVDLVVDHSIMVDHYGKKNSLDLNMKLEFQRNNERYQFMKWGMQAFDTFGVVPPGFGIVHQVNLEYLARGVHKRADGVYYPDTLVGTDSHTTMINGIGVVGWGVGGIEAEAAMLGQPVYMLTPDVVGFELTGRLREGVTATDLVLRVTEALRKEKVVGKFVEFFGEGTRTLALPDRATIANMAPEYGATMGFFPVDEKTIDYFTGTGRTKAEIEAFEAYFRAQGLFGVPLPGQIDFSQVVKLDLGDVTPSLAGPKRPQDRIELGQVATQFASLFSKPIAENGFNQPAAMLATRHLLLQAGQAHPDTTPGVPPTPAGAPRMVAEMEANRPTLETAHADVPAPATPKAGGITIGNGDVLIAAITSCTNTSNPSVLLAAGLLAKKAVEAGLKVQPHIKTSLAPGSRIVTEYLTNTGLLPYLEKLGFALAGYGCTTCIGNAGDLTPEINEAINKSDLVCAAVLSGNRNFEARIHPNLKANFLASPPLVVAYAIAGTVMRDLMTEPVGKGKGGKDVYLGDIWPTSDEIYKLMKFAMNGKAFRENYAKVKTEPGKLWEKIQGVTGTAYTWPVSTYIAEPPFFKDFAMENVAARAERTGAAGQKDAVSVKGARIMALFGDSITTDHISPAGSIKGSSPAGQWLLAHGVQKADFNSYGARRGNHEVMMRGTFANVRIKNLMIPAGPDGSREEGGVTLFQPGGDKMFIYDAAMKYMNEGMPTVIFAGEEYGTGSSRDWAAKGTQLLGIKAVVARSFERIHRSNLVGMGVLPLQFLPGDSWQTLRLTGKEVIDVLPDPELKPQSRARLVVTREDGSREEIEVILRIDTPIEVDYYRHGGILPFVLRQLLA